MEGKPRMPAEGRVEGVRVGSEGYRRVVLEND